MLLRWIPNLLTISRCGLALLVLLACIKVTFSQACDNEQIGTQVCGDLAQNWAQLALLAFITGVITDFLDGWTARTLKSESRFGVWLDPIADKLLIAAALVGLSVIYHAWAIVIPTILIVTRDIFITVFRMTTIGRKVVQVSPLAKQKTALEMVAITLLMLPLALTKPEEVPNSYENFNYVIGILFVLPLWFASLLSVLSLVQYLQLAFKKSD